MGVANATIVCTDTFHHTETKRAQIALCSFITSSTEFLFEPDLKSPFAAFADRFGYQVLFLLKRHVNYPPLSRVQNSEGEGNTVFSNMTRRKFCHRMQLGFAGLAKTFRIDNKAMLSIETAAHDLK
jgi:hypothetical protein